jgi:hypothetical protein
MQIIDIINRKHIKKKKTQWDEIKTKNLITKKKSLFQHTATRHECMVINHAY